MEAVLEANENVDELMLVLGLLDHDISRPAVGARHQNAATDIQVLDIRMGSGEVIRVVNVYDQARSRKDRTRSCQQADWKRILDFPGGGIVVAGDMNANTPVWNGSANATPFRENMVKENNLEIQNSEGTARYGGQCHPIIDLTFREELICSGKSGENSIAPARTTR